MAHKHKTHFKLLLHSLEIRLLNGSIFHDKQSTPNTNISKFPLWLANLPNHCWFPSNYHPSDVVGSKKCLNSCIQVGWWNLPYPILSKIGPQFHDPHFRSWKLYQRGLTPVASKYTYLFNLQNKVKSQAAAHDITAYPTPRSEKKEKKLSPADLQQQISTWVPNAYLQSSDTKMEAFEEHSTAPCRQEMRLCLDSIAQPACHALVTKSGSFR